MDFVGIALAVAVVLMCLNMRRIVSMITSALASSGTASRIASSPLPKSAAAPSSTIASCAAAPSSAIIPKSVNYHYTRVCNYECGFCFHTQKSETLVPLEEMKRGVRMLREAGMEKINFSGGEPFLNPRLLADLVRFCKGELHLSVSIVSNGSRITEDWIEDNHEFVDYLAISCDSFDYDTNQRIGRREKGRVSGALPQFEIAERVQVWCERYGILFKLNTVVNTFNAAEDMGEALRMLRPARWKVFQCLALEGENTGADAKRNVSSFLISTEAFQAFVERHKAYNPVVESNENMKDSYLILDEKMRFLNCQNGDKRPSSSILEVGVAEALASAGFDEAAFVRRGGAYEYHKASVLQSTACSRQGSTAPDIEDLCR